MKKACIYFPDKEINDLLTKTKNIYLNEYSTLNIHLLCLDWFPNVHRNSYVLIEMDIYERTIQSLDNYKWNSY